MTQPPQQRPRVAEEGEAGWAGRVMTWLRFATYAVGVNLLMLLGTLAGAVVLGIFPSLVSGSALLARLAAGDPSERPWSDFWTGWRSGFARSNVLGIPVWLAAAFVIVDANLLSQANEQAPGNETLVRAMSVAVGLFAGYLLVALAFLFPVARRYTDSFGPTWRFVLVAPLLAPATSLGVVAVLAVSLVLFFTYPALVPLAGLALPLLPTGWLADRALDRIDARSEDGASDEPDEEPGEASDEAGDDVPDGESADDSDVSGSDGSGPDHSGPGVSGRDD